MCFNLIKKWFSQWPITNFLTYERSSDGPQLFTSATRLKLKSDSLRSNFRFSPVDHLVSPPLLSLPTSSLRGSEFERLSNRSTAFFYTFHAIRLVFPVDMHQLLVPMLRVSRRREITWVYLRPGDRYTT